MSFDFFSFLREVGRINEKKENHNRWPPTPRRGQLEKKQKIIEISDFNKSVSLKSLKLLNSIIARKFE